MQQNIENPSLVATGSPSFHHKPSVSAGCRYPIITRMKHINRKLCLRRFRLLGKGNIFQNGRLSLSHTGIGSISASVFSTLVNCNAYLQPWVGVQNLKLLSSETHLIPPPPPACHKNFLLESVVTELAEKIKVKSFRWNSVALTWFKITTNTVIYRRVWFVITLACAIYHNLFNADTY